MVFNFNRWEFRGNYSAPVSATEIGRELQRIGQADDGLVTVEGVVEAARSPGNPIHPCFPWDDRIAAEEHRKEIARKLIRSVVPVRENSDRRPEIFYVHIVKEDRTNAYAPMPLVIEKKEYREQAFRDAMSGLESWRKRCADIQQFDSAEFRAMFREIDRVLAAQKVKGPGQPQPAPNP